MMFSSGKDIIKPCIDIHQGRVKQIVGSSIKNSNEAVENYVCKHSANYYGEYFSSYGLYGGHIILLDGNDYINYNKSLEQAKLVLSKFPDTFDIGGGINIDNAMDFFQMGARKIIVTSFLIDKEKNEFNKMGLEELSGQISKNKLVVDISPKKNNKNNYCVSYNRWQSLSNTIIDFKLLAYLDNYCGELLVHGVDVEGKKSGFDRELVSLLTTAKENNIFHGNITYAGGIRDYENIQEFLYLSKRQLGLTIGSALSIFGGHLDLTEIIQEIDSFK